jgi:hypothetical protein
MRILFLFLLTAIVFSSCRKIYVDAGETLVSHKWYPYQTRIVTSDTTTLISYESSGYLDSARTIFHKDTTYYLDKRIQQSIYSFQQNGISQITDMCSAGQQTTDTPWAIQPNRVLQIVFIDDPVAETYYSKLFPPILLNQPPPTDFYPTQNGLLTQFSASQFVVDQTSLETWSAGYYKNGIMVDSVVRIVSDMFITFRSQ